MVCSQGYLAHQNHALSAQLQALQQRQRRSPAVNALFVNPLANNILQDTRTAHHTERGSPVIDAWHVTDSQAGHEALPVTSQYALASGQAAQNDELLAQGSERDSSPITVRSASNVTLQPSLIAGGAAVSELQLHSASTSSQASASVSSTVPEAGQMATLLTPQLAPPAGLDYAASNASSRLVDYWVSGIDGTFPDLPPEQLTGYYSLGMTDTFTGDIMVPGNAAKAFRKCSFKKEVIVMCTDVGDIWFEFVFGQIMMMQERGYAHVIVYMDNEHHCQKFQSCATPPVFALLP